MEIMDQLKKDYSVNRVEKYMVTRISKILAPCIIIIIATFIGARREHIILTIQAYLIAGLIYAIFYKLINRLVASIIRFPCSLYVRKQEIKDNDLQFISFAESRLEYLYKKEKIDRDLYYTTIDYLEELK